MIPFLDLREQYQSIKDEIDAAVAGVLESGRYALGDAVSAFEKEFAQKCGTREAVAVNSGTSALHLSLLAAGIGPGDEVITVPFTFIATAAAIQYTGARPVFADIEFPSCTIDPAKTEAAITDRTKALLPVHLYGQAADMDPLREIARKHGFIVIEDACQAHLATYKGKKVGSIGEMGCFSFYAGKNLGACGEGGMVVTDDREKAHLMRTMRDWGQEEKYHHVRHGFNYRMDGIQGAILSVKLKRLEEWNRRRRECAALYRDLLAGKGIGLPEEMGYGEHVFHLYAIRTPDRDGVRERLQEKGIGTGIHYPIPLHLQPVCANLGYREGDFPNSERMALETLSLPIYPELKEEAVKTVADNLLAIRDEVAENSRRTSQPVEDGGRSPALSS